MRLRSLTPDPAAYDATLRGLIGDRVASRLAAADPGLWGQSAEEEASQRLAWVALPRTSRALVEETTALRAELLGRGMRRLVLCGMGGSSLGPEVICGAAGVPIEVLDTSHPDTIRASLERGLDDTVVVISSKSGSTMETDNLHRVWTDAFTRHGIAPADRIVVVTDPGSPLDADATAAGLRVIRADPDVGGRFAALSAFGLVPSGLAGVDISQLLDQAEGTLSALATDDPSNPGLRLGALLGLAATEGVDKLVLRATTPAYAGLADWIEQLIAESTGKRGRGLLPVVTSDPSSPDAVVVSLDDDTVPGSTSGFAAGLDTPLGAQLQLWEVATAIAGRILEINPFDQPDVESAKEAARERLREPGRLPAARFVDGDVAVHAGDWLAADAQSAAEAVRALLTEVDPERGYLAVHAYLDRTRTADLANLRAELARLTGRPVTFGWGPRFLHSTGQYHKGGPRTGVFLQLTAEPVTDLDVPGRELTFGQVLLAQAVGDGQVLDQRGRPVLRLHLTDPARDLTTLLEVSR